MPVLGDLAHNLLSLEINTLLCDGITAEKMPAAGDALLDVAQRYHRFLRNRIGELLEAGVDVALPALVVAATPIAFGEWRIETASPATFAALRRAAQGCIVALHRQPLHGWALHEIILDRICINSEQISAIWHDAGQDAATGDTAAIDVGAAAAKALPRLSQAETVLLRKIWEIGAETVAMQTVILIDGDVFNRIQTGWEADLNQALHGLHRQSVEACINQWTNLFRIAAELIGSVVFQGFFRSGSPGPDSVPPNA